MGLSMETPGEAPAGSGAGAATAEAGVDVGAGGACTGAAGGGGAVAPRRRRRILAGPSPRSIAVRSYRCISRTSCRIVRTSGFSVGSAGSSGMPGLRITISNWKFQISDAGWRIAAVQAGDAQSPGQARQDLGALGGHEDIVLDPDATTAGQVDAGLDGDDHAGPEHDVGFPAEERGLVDVHADAVAQAVGKKAAEAGLLDRGAGFGVNVASRHAR